MNWDGRYDFLSNYRDLCHDRLGEDVFVQINCINGEYILKIVQIKNSLMQSNQFVIRINIINILRSDLQKQTIEVRVIIKETLAQLVVLAAFFGIVRDLFDLSI